MDNERDARKVIEFVCTGNSGRSPVAELFGNRYLQQRGLSLRYVARSSGTLVDAINSGSVHVNAMIPFVEQALDRGDVFTPDFSVIAQEALDKGNEADIKTAYNAAINRFVAEEHAYRGQVLDTMGYVPSQIKTTPEQIVPQANRVAVLAMDRGNYDRVRKLYAFSNLDPIIDELARFARGSEGDEIPNAFGKGRQAYKGAVAKIAEYVPIAVQKILVGDR